MSGTHVRRWATTLVAVFVLALVGCNDSRDTSSEDTSSEGYGSERTISEDTGSEDTGSNERVAGEVTKEDLLSRVETHTITIQKFEADATKIVAVTTETGGNSLTARLGDTVVWKNESGRDVRLDFDQLGKLFGVDTVSLAPGAEESLTIQWEAHFGNPGHRHKIEISDSDQTPGSTIIVCPPYPLPCN